jgi:hypothetical protein
LGCPVNEQDEERSLWCYPIGVQPRTAQSRSSAKPRVVLIDDGCDDALGYHEVLPVLGPLAAGGPRTESGWSDVGFRLDGGSTVDVEFSDEAA